MNAATASLKNRQLILGAALALATGALNAADSLVWQATSGAWDVADNWLLGDGSGNPTTEAGHVPTGDDAVFFGPKWGNWTTSTPTNEIALGASSAEVARFDLNRKSVSVFDLGKQALAVKTRFIVNSGADVTLKNGTFRHLNEDTSGLAKLNEVNSAILRLVGVDAACQSKTDLKLKKQSGDTALLEISEGASFQGGMAIENVATGTELAQVTIRGEGTSVQPGKFAWDADTQVTGGGISISGSGPVRIDVRDGAVVDMTDAHLAVVGTTSDAVVVIDNAFFTNRHVNAGNREIKVGCQGGWNTLLVTNNAVLYTEMGINVANDPYKDIAEGSGPSNALVVADGGAVVLAANSSGDVRSLKVGAAHGDARLVLDSGRIETPGSVVVGADTAASNNVLVVRGTNSLLTATDLELSCNAQMRYEIPQAGLVRAPVQIARHVCARYNYGLAWYGEAPSLTLSADAWIQKTGGKLTLLTCGTVDDKGLNKKVLEQLRDTGNADLARQGHDTSRTKLTVVEKTNGTPALRLVLSSPRMSGLLFILR